MNNIIYFDRIPMMIFFMIFFFIYGYRIFSIELYLEMIWEDA